MYDQVLYENILKIFKNPQILMISKSIKLSYFVVEEEYKQSIQTIFKESCGVRV